MPQRKPIPERAPIADTFTGVVLQTDAGYVLAQQPHTGAAVVRQGTLLLRYAVQYLGKPHIAIVPGLLALDYGDMLTGEDAWVFLLERSNRYPRADVVGYLTDGTDEMIPVKWLDLAVPIQVHVYADARATQADLRVLALIAPDNTDTITVPPRVLEYLPQYPSVRAWLAGRTSDE